jgi:zinc protease
MAVPLLRRPPVDRFHLPNGLKVLLAPMPASPTVSVWVWYRVGSKNERPGLTGASHWVEHMLFEGSPRYPKGAIDRAVLEVGGQLNAFTDADFTAYFTTVPREHLAVPLDIESDRMTRASITDREVERERTVIRSEREGNENWPEFRVEEEAYALAFRVHPYRWDALGRKEDILALTPEELRTYYRRFYGPRNATLVVAGGFDRRAVAADVRRRFSRLPDSGEEVAVTAVEPPPSGERRAELSGPGTTPYLQVSWRAPSVRDPAGPATALLDTILGGESRLFSSRWGRGGGEHPGARLFRALVDPGLAVRAGSEWHPRLYPDLFSIHVQAARGVSLDRVESEVDRLTAELARTGPTARELEEARTRIARGAELAYEGASRTGFRLGYFAALGSPDLERALLRRLLAVRRTEVRDRAGELFRRDARVVVRYTPTEEVAPDG